MVEVFGSTLTLVIYICLFPWQGAAIALFHVVLIGAAFKQICAGSERVFFQDFVAVHGHTAQDWFW